MSSVPLRAIAASPFRPGSDDVPAVWAGRDGELADWWAVVERRLAGVYERGRAVLGEFGIGKSVLVNRIAAEAERDGHLVARPLRVPLGVDALALLADGLRDLVLTADLDARVARAADGLLERVEEIRLPVVGGGVRTRPTGSRGDRLPHRAVYDLLVHLGRLARADGRLVLVRLDEIQNVTAPATLSQVLTVFGDALDASVDERDVAGLPRRPKLPVVVYLSGLPDFRRRAADAGATFSRRFRTFDLEPLTEPELRGALVPFTTTGWEVLTDDGPATVHMTPGAVDVVVGRSLGDPFVFQLAGEAAWAAGTGPVITEEEARRGWDVARREVRGVVEGRLAGLSDLQVRFLRAAAALDDDERTAANVARAVGYERSSQVASTAHGLDVERGLLRREAGRIAFRSPSVRAYLADEWP